MNCRHGNLTTFKNSPYLFTMNTIGAFQIPLFLVSVYCILKKSPWNMVFYKWLILVFQLAYVNHNLFGVFFSFWNITLSYFKKIDSKLELSH